MVVGTADNLWKLVVLRILLRQYLQISWSKSFDVPPNNECLNHQLFDRLSELDRWHWLAKVPNTLQKDPEAWRE